MGDDLIRRLRGEICGSKGFAGPRCCIARPDHIGEDHIYGVPEKTTLLHLEAATQLAAREAEIEKLKEKARRHVAEIKRLARRRKW